MAELENTPPPGYTQTEWENETCCVCWGCSTCDEHDCHRTPEEREKEIARTKELLERMRLDDGSKDMEKS